MKSISFSILAVFFLIGMSQHAFAEIVSAGEPKEVRVEQDPGFTFADIYQRQLDYREKRLLLHEDIKERQKNFAAPSLQAQRQYEENVSKHNALTPPPSESE